MAIIEVRKLSKKFRVKLKEKGFNVDTTKINIDEVIDEIMKIKKS